MVGVAPVLYQGDMRFSFAVTQIAGSVLEKIVNSVFMEILWFKDGYDILYLHFHIDSTKNM